jgi:UDP-N-acetyl-D-galactosamine dehydrogenase
MENENGRNTREGRLEVFSAGFIPHRGWPMYPPLPYTRPMEKPVLGIVGLGYVGLPLAHAFARKGYRVIGYDISSNRIAELSRGHDRTRELTDAQLKEAPMEFTDNPAALKEADIQILAIPTPVDDDNNPDLTLVESASVTVGRNLKKGAIVVYESTVYPGVTEDICGPILERESGMVCGKDFTLGYSPERINPGDKTHTIDKIVKIVAGQDPATLDRLADVYGSIVTAGIHRAPSIKVAEMAKAIENAQRDLNIAFVNEIAMLCSKIGISSKDVLDAAGTKWNFLPFRPGLVGGHCIGVDPYYLVEKAKQLGMQTHVITAGRQINDGMSTFIAHKVAAELGEGSKRVLVLGLTFKENVPDTRNSKCKDVVAHFAAMGHETRVHDPFVSEEELKRWSMEPGSLEDEPFDAVLLLVPHKEYLEMPVSSIIEAVKPGGILFDLKSILDPKTVQAAGKRYLSL